MSFAFKLSRRAMLAGAGAATFLPTSFAIGQQAKVKIGLMLPYSGTFAALGQNITDSLMMAINEKGREARRARRRLRAPR